VTQMNNPQSLDYEGETSLTPRAKDVVDRLMGPLGGGSTWRPRAVVLWAGALADADGPVFWEVVIATYPSFDLVPQEDFARLFARFATSMPPVNLPKRLTVYRGQSADQPKGLSWTLNREVAEGFARGHRFMNPNPVVLQLQVTRDQVAMYLTDRDEETVVLKAIPA